jgi:hypothetical protein
MNFSPACARVLFLLFGGSAYGAACAADPGDPLKGQDNGIASPGPDGSTTVPVEEGSIGVEDASSTPPVQPEGSTTVNEPDSGQTTTTPSEDSSTPMGEPDAAMEAAMTPPEAGSGCAAGAALIPIAYGVNGGNSGNFGTAGPACVQLMGSVKQGWGISNGTGRTVTLTSASGTMGPVDATAYQSLTQTPQAGPDGNVYWNFTAGAYDYCSMYIF